MNAPFCFFTCRSALLLRMDTAGRGGPSEGYELAGKFSCSLPDRAGKTSPSAWAVSGAKSICTDDESCPASSVVCPRGAASMSFLREHVGHWTFCCPSTATATFVSGSESTRANINPTAFGRRHWKERGRNPATAPSLTSSGVFPEFVNFVNGRGVLHFAGGVIAVVGRPPRGG